MAEKNIDQLAELLAAAVGIKVKESPEDTIQAAIDKLNDNKSTKPIAKAVKADVKDQIKEDHVQPPELEETIADMYVSNLVPPFWDRVRMKYMGVPDLKSWAELDKINCKALQDTTGDVTEDSEDPITDDDITITWEDIEKFLNGMTADEYVHTCYDNDEYDWDDSDQQKLLDCVECKEVNDLDDDQLDEKLAQCRETVKASKTADELVEALTIQQRLQKAMKMRSKAKQIALKRKIALKRHATPEKLQDRAHKLAIRMLKNRFSGGTPYNELSYADRNRIEKQLANKKQLVNTLSKRMLPVVKKIEQQRFASKPVEQFNKE